MEIRDVIRALDARFEKEDFSGARRLLYGALEEALAAADHASAVSLWNEIMGLERQYGELPLAKKAADAALSLLEREGLAVSRPGAMVCLNAATVYKRCGDNETAETLYDRAAALFPRFYPAGAPEFAGLYNNMAALYLDTARYDKAEYYYGRAADILRRRGEICDLAVTYWNFAALYNAWQPFSGKTEENAESAMALLRGVREPDAYFAYTCRKCAGAAAELGFFAAEQELQERADAYYAQH